MRSGHWGTSVLTGSGASPELCWRWPHMAGRTAQVSGRAEEENRTENNYPEPSFWFWAWLLCSGLGVGNVTGGFVLVTCPRSEDKRWEIIQMVSCLLSWLFFCVYFFAVILFCSLGPCCECEPEFRLENLSAAPYTELWRSDAPSRRRPAAGRHCKYQTINK